MAWDLEMGPKLDRLLAREKQGKEVPELLSRPALGRRTQWIMDLYERLATERPIGFGTWGAIPHSKVVAEALRLGLGEDGLHELWEHIKALDLQWRAVANAPASSTGATGGGLSHQDHSGSKRRGSRKPRSST
jgi:hypothetical protein